MAKKKKTRVLVGTPNFTNDYGAEVYASHMMCARQWQKMGIDFQFVVAGRTFVHFARTQICQAFMAAEEWTHLLWLDDDAIIAPEILPAMLAHDLDVVISPYPMRRSPFEIGILIATHWSCPKCDQEVFSDAFLPELASGIECKCGTDMFRDYHDHRSYRNLKIADLDCGVQEVDGGGTHCMLVKKEVFTTKTDHKIEDMIDPRLAKLLDKLSEDERRTMDHNVGNLPSLNMSFKEEDDAEKNYFVMPKSGTEDMLWCYRAKQKDVKIHVDTDIFADHLGFAPVITRAFREHMEDMELESQGPRPRVGFIEVMKGRDHTKILKDREVSLV